MSNIPTAQQVEVTDNNIPTARQPGSGVDLTNRPIIVYGIRVPDNDPELASVMRRVANLAIVIALLQGISFVIIFLNGGYVENAGGSDQELSLASGLFTLFVFGLCVPLFGYWGAKKQDINGLSLFCFGEGMVAVFGGCEFVMTVLLVSTYLQACSSEQCVHTFQNISNTECYYSSNDEEYQRRDSSGYSVQRDTCQQVLQHWGFWSMVTVSGFSVCAGVMATQYSMKLRTSIINKLHIRHNNVFQQQNRSVHIVPVGGVVATTTVIQRGMQHYDDPVQGTAVANTDENIPRAQAVV